MKALKKAPLSLATWTTLSLNLSARDKLIKMLQYLARILFWYYQGGNPAKSILGTLQQVKDVTSLSRRSFRLFRSVNHINRMYNAVSELVDHNRDAQLDDVLINSVGIFEDFLLVLYFGYENYLLLVSTKILKIKSETETALRNSSSLVSLVGNFLRILGVCLRINRSKHMWKKKKRKLDIFILRRSLDRGLSMEEIVSNNLTEKRELSHTEGSEKSVKLQAIYPQSTNERKSRDVYDFETEEIENENENDAYTIWKSEENIFQENNSEILRAKTGIQTKNVGLIASLFGPKSAEGKKDFEKERKNQQNAAFFAEKNRLEEDLLISEQERSTLCSDAIVVTLELLISANYRPFCFWERMFGFKVLHEGHEGVVGIISSVYVLNNLWPVQPNCP